MFGDASLLRLLDQIVEAIQRTPERLSARTPLKLGTLTAKMTNKM